MKRTELTEVPTRDSRSKVAEIYPDISDGAVWELDEGDASKLGYASLESLRASLISYVGKRVDGVELTVSQRNGSLFVQVETTARSSRGRNNE